MTNKNEKFREENILPSGLSLNQAEEEGFKLVEAEYIKSFISGHSRYYSDERSAGKKQSIRANADGSEDLIEFDRQTGNETLIRNLVPVGKGKYAYLLRDPRFLSQKLE